MTDFFASAWKASLASVTQRGRVALLGAGLLAVASCGGESTPSGPINNSALAPFVGTWDATEFVHTHRDTPATTIDLIADGATFTVTISASGQYVGTVQVSTESRTETGTMRVVGSELVIQPVSPPSAEERVTFVVSGNLMTWTGPSEYDFNSDGIPSPTNVRIVFAKS